MHLELLGVMIRVGEGAIACSILNIYVLGKSDESKRLPLWQFPIKLGCQLDMVRWNRVDNYFYSGTGEMT